VVARLEQPSPRRFGDCIRGTTEEGKAEPAWIVPGAIEHAVRLLWMVEDRARPALGEAVVVSGGETSVGADLDKAGPGEVDDTTYTDDLDERDTPRGNICLCDLDLSGRTARVAERLDERALNVSPRIQDPVLPCGIVEAVTARVTKVQAGAVVAPVEAWPEVVGSAAAIEWLGASDVLVSPLPMGRGFTKARHGVLPLPPPATVDVDRLANGLRELSGVSVAVADGIGWPPPRALEAFDVVLTGDVGGGTESALDRLRRSVADHPHAATVAAQVLRATSGMAVGPPLTWNDTCGNDAYDPNRLCALFAPGDVCILNVCLTIAQMMFQVR